ncbi:coaA, partial [Symbiodinium sp. KB8]
MANLTAVAESGKWDELRDVEQPTTWMLVTLKAGSKKKLVVDGTGAGGLDEFKAALRDVQFGVYRVLALDQRGGRTSKRCRLLYVHWQGPEVKPMARARFTSIKADVASFFTGCSNTYFIE